MIYLPNAIVRLKTVILASALALVGNGMQAGAQGLAVLLAGRGIGGFAGGVVYGMATGM